MTRAATIHASPPLTEKEWKKKKKKNIHGKMGTRVYLVQHEKRPPLPTLLLFSLKQRGYTWINCAEQRLNYVG